MGDLVLTEDEVAPAMSALLEQGVDVMRPDSAYLISGCYRKAPAAPDRCVRLNLSSDLSVSSYLQYDTDTESLGVNTRLRWTFRPAGDLFVVHNHNVQSLQDRWHLESNQLLVKLQYAWRR